MDFIISIHIHFVVLVLYDLVVIPGITDHYVFMPLSYLEFHSIKISLVRLLDFCQFFLLFSSLGTLHNSEEYVKNCFIFPFSFSVINSHHLKEDDLESHSSHPALSPELELLTGTANSELYMLHK